MSTASLPDRPAPAIGPNVSAFTLANGLEIVVIPDHRAPVVTHMVWYRVGGADEPKGKSGIAHFLEHLMFKGTEKHPGGFSKQVAELGGQENAFTSYDYTAYYQRVAKQHLTTMMAFEADRMQGLALTDAVVDPERDVVLEERKMRVDNNPPSQLMEEIASTLFTHHPYGTPIIGWENEIEGLTRQDALDFHARFYTPNNAILVVAGDVTEAEVRDAAGATYGALARRAEPPPRLRPREPEQRADRRVRLADKRVEQPIWQRHWRVPSERQAAPGEAEALDVMAQILGGGPTSRLYRELVAERKIASHAHAGYASSALDEGRVTLMLVPLPQSSFEALESGAEEVLAALAGQGVGVEELERAKTKLVADAAYAQDSQMMLGYQFGAALAIGGGIADVIEWPSRISAVTAEQVQDAARRHLLGKCSVIGILDAA